MSKYEKWMTLQEERMLQQSNDIGSLKEMVSALLRVELISEPEIHYTSVESQTEVSSVS